MKWVGIEGDHDSFLSLRYFALRYVTIWVFVCHLDREEALFNPNCRTLHLLEDIKRRCNCAENAVIDLSDLQGAVKNLTDHQAANASEFLNERETFILVRVEKNCEGRDFPLYTPLLHDEDVLTTDFLESLRRTPTDTLDISGRTSSRAMRRGSLRPNIKTKVSGNLSPTGSNPTGNKLPVGRRRSTANRRS